MQADFPHLPQQDPVKLNPIELLMTTDQMKVISPFLPKGFSLQIQNKNTRKGSKN